MDLAVGSDREAGRVARHPVRARHRARRLFYNGGIVLFRFLFFRRLSVTFFYYYTNLALIAILLVSGGLLAWPALRRGRGGLSAAEATQLINRRNAVVIDLRAPSDFAAGHLPSARQVAAGEIGAKIAQVAKNKSTPVLLVCQNGQQSQKAAREVEAAGYAEVHVLEGGVAAWQQAGMPVVKQGVAK
jgi:rhodanese-related sulfurtransferase